MNVYDFDKTIYDGDSSTHFYFYMALRHPIALVYLPIQFWYWLRYVLGLSDKTAMKERIFRPVRHVKDIDRLVERFWARNDRRIKQWYLDSRTNNDVVISASPRFLLEPICNRLGVRLLIASEIDKHSGKYSGVNCYGDEKVRRLREMNLPDPIETFYSDSYSDSPLAALARQSWLVKGNKLYEWKKSDGLRDFS